MPSFVTRNGVFGWLRRNIGAAGETGSAGDPLAGRFDPLAGDPRDSTQRLPQQFLKRRAFPWFASSLVSASGHTPARFFF
jgi:hypothetical protein